MKALRIATPARPSTHPGPEEALARGQVLRALLGEDEDVEPVRIGRFVLLQRLGAGGMGVVWTAYDSDLERRIALKVLLSDRTDAQPRLLREAQAMARLSHPNVAVVYEVGIHERRIYLAMEFVEGETLRRWGDAERRPWRKVLATYLQAGHGLAAAHALGIVHRDFKPENAIIGRDGRVRVLDFGLSRLDADRPASATTSDDRSAASETSSLTRSGALLGTPAYMAPEQWLGRAADARTDQFSFCVALWEALCGERPFTGTTSAELGSAVTGGALRVPAQRLEPWLRKVLERGLATDPDRRFATINELLAALACDPTRARRRRLAVGGLFALGITAAAGVQIDHMRTRQSCGERGEDVSAIWNDEARRSAEQGVFASGSPLAAQTWPRVEPLLDDYAARWREVAEQTCLAAELEHTLTPDVYEKVRACLDERRESLLVLVEALATADAPMVERAASVSLGLPRIEPCGDAESSELRMSLPDGDASRSEVAEVRRGITRARALESLARYEAAAASLVPLVEQAVAIGWDPLIARARLALAEVRSGEGRYDEAIELATAAFHDAARSGADVPALDAALMLGYLQGSARAQVEEGLAWSRLAETMHARAGGHDELRRARMLDIRGSVYVTAADYEPAIESYRAALEIRERELGPDHSLVAITLANLGGALQKRAEFEEAASVLVRAIAIMEAVLGRDHPAVAAAASNLAGVQVERGDNEAAVADLTRAIATMERAAGAEHPSIATMLNNRGLARLRLGDRDGAIVDLRRAQAIAESSFGPDHPDVARALHNLGRAHYERGEYDDAVDALLRAVALRERAFGSDHASVAQSYETLARVYLAKDEHAAALSSVDRALAITDRGDGDQADHVAAILRQRGRIHVARGDLGDAVDDYARALMLLEAQPAASDEKAKVALAEARFTLAGALWDLGEERPRALELARHARANLDELGAAAPRSAVAEVDAWLGAHRSAVN